MFDYAEQLPTELSDEIGQQQADVLSRKLIESCAVEHFGRQSMHLPHNDRDAKFSQLDETAGYFRAAARPLQVHQ